MTFFALITASGFCGALLLYRSVETHHDDYDFLAWNLFLAWVPFIAALTLYDADRRGLPRAMRAALAVTWLLFLPNAPYIVTDLLHVGVLEGAPIWFDALLVSSFAGTGLLLGFGSLLLVQSVVTRSAGATWGWLMLAPALGLCAVGIVLGRVFRFNSWDALVRPGALLRTIAEHATDPTALVGGAALVMALTASLAAGYFVLYAFARPDAGD
jgi:uncharacterized membrane protein